MSLGGIKGFAGGGGGQGPVGPGTPVSAISTNSVAMGVAGPGISNILSATLLIGITGAPANSFGVSLNVYAGSSPGLAGFFAVGGITELTSSVLQFAGIGQAVGGTLGIRVNQSSGSTPGFLSAADWTTFNAKQDALKIAAVNAASYANGATLFGATFQLGPADGSNPGVVTTTGQTFAGDKSFIGVVAAANGSASAVGLHLGTDVATGFFRSAANQLSIAANGTTVAVIGTGSINNFLPYYGAAGTTGAPEYSFAADTDTGIYNPAANTLGFVVGSTQSFQVDNTKILSTVPNQTAAGTTGAPAWSYSADSDTGIYNPAANTLGLVVGSTEVINLSSVAQKNIVAFQGASGSVSAPSHSFIGATTMGLYISGVSNMGIAIGGANTAYFSPNALNISGASSGVNTIAAGASLTSHTYTLPLAQGAASSVLTNNGSGTLSWAAQNIGATFLISTTSGAFTTGSTTFVDVTNLSASITTTGKPVILLLIPDGDLTGGNEAYLGNAVGTVHASAQSFYQFVRGSTGIGTIQGIVAAGAATSIQLGLPVGSATMFDIPSAGTYTYKFQAKSAATETTYVLYTKLVAYLPWG